MLTGAAMGFGLGPLLAQMLLQQSFSPEVVAFYRFAIPLLLVLPYLRVFKTKPAEAWRTFALGMVGAIGMLALLYCFTWLPATTVILTYYTYPLFALAIGWAFFGHCLTRNRLISAALIVLAVLLLQGPLSGQDASGWALCLLCIAPASYALFINYFTNPVEPLSAGQRLSACLSGHLIVLIPLILWQDPQMILPQSQEQLWLVLAIGLLASALPQGLFARGAPLAGMERTTMISTSEIVFALVFSVALLQNEISRLEMISSALILIAGLIRLEATRDKPTDRTSNTSGQTRRKGILSSLLSSRYGKAPLQ